MFSEVGSTGRPQISARTRAMMLMMLTGRPQRWLPRARNDAGRGGGRERHQSGTGRARTHAYHAGQGGKGRRRDQGKGRGGGPFARSSLPPAQ